MDRQQLLKHSGCFAMELSGICVAHAHLGKPVSLLRQHILSHRFALQRTSLYYSDPFMIQVKRAPAHSADMIPAEGSLSRSHWLQFYFSRWNHRIGSGADECPRPPLLRETSLRRDLKGWEETHSAPGF